MIKRPVESGWGGNAVADSVGSDRGGSGEPAQHDSVHRPVGLVGLAGDPVVRQFLVQTRGLFFLFSSVEIDSLDPSSLQRRLSSQA